MSEQGASDPRPGPLRGQARLVLHTRQAQMLIKGRSGDQRPPIIGLLRFGMLVRTVQAAAEKGDPYAQWRLLRVEQALDQASEELTATGQQQQARLAAAPFQVEPPVSTEPVEAPLWLASPCAFRGAALLAEYDKIARTLLAAGHYGLLTRAEAERLLNLAGRSVRRAFNSVLGYRALGVTREDVRRNNAKAQEARKQMGPLPESVLNGEQRPSYGPRRKLTLKPKDSAPPSPSSSKPA